MPNFVLGGVYATQTTLRNTKAEQGKPAARLKLRCGARGKDTSNILDDMNTA